MVNAMLTGDIADRPSGAEVTAVVTKAFVLENTKIPSGAEVHGVVDGSSALFIFLNFKFFRLKDGRVVNFEGKAHDPSGRQGVLGQKLINGATATGVAANVGGNLVDKAGQMVADGVDNQLAKTGLKSSFSETGKRSDKLNGEEDVVVAKKGTAFVIYVGGKSSQ
jgi:hypothetical protein